MNSVDKIVNLPASDVNTIGALLRQDYEIVHSIVYNEMHSRNSYFAQYTSYIKYFLRKKTNG